MIDTFKKALLLLNAKERRNGGLVLGMAILMAVLETVGVAAVMPFLQVLGDPSLIEQNRIFSMIYMSMGFQSADRFLLVFGLAIFGFILFAAGFRIFTIYAINRFVHMRRHTIGCRLLETYLRQPYSFFLNRHSGDLAKGILSEVDQVIQNVYKPILHAVAYMFVAVALLALLLVVDPTLALVVAGTIGGLYFVIFRFVKGFLIHIGRDRAAANQQRFKAAGEAFGGIKDIKLLGREYAYISRFRGPSARFARHQASNATLSEAPKFLIEAVAIGGALLMVLVLMKIREEGFQDIVPILGLYAVGGYKLIPAIQRVYQGMARMNFGTAAVHDLYREFQMRSSLAEIRHQAERVLVPREKITINEIGFQYPGASAPSLSNISLSINVGSSVGIVGGTGAGKTTLMDIVLGLLQPTTGELRVDNVVVTESNIREWQQSLGYVPQEIFLTDSSVAENIALGVPTESIDRRIVEECARMAQIHEFITCELPEGYHTEVGERGVRLSGGQRQRIGIARALYHDPEVLLFDEATSALDNNTEKALMDAVNALRKHKTIIMIAHRLSTVRNCSSVILLEEGRVTSSGTYEELRRKSERFRVMSASSGNAD